MDRRSGNGILRCVRRVAATFLLVCAIGSAAAVETDEATKPAGPRAFLHFFDQLALAQQAPGFNWRPRWVRRWTGPVQVRLAGAPPPRGFRARLQRSLAQISVWTGQRFVLANGFSGRNRITIRIVPHAAMVARYGRGGMVCTTVTRGWRGRLRRGELDISDRFADCLDHELMHAIGFDGHWRARFAGDPIRSVLAQRHAPSRVFRFSAFDAAAIRLLYHDQLRPGMARPYALAVLRRLLNPYKRL